jgi:hypothetical protein
LSPFQFRFLGRSNQAYWPSRIETPRVSEGWVKVMKSRSVLSISSRLRWVRQFPQTLYVLFAVLDLVEYGGARLAPGIVSALACQLRSFGTLAYPLLASSVVSSITTGCPAATAEPLTSQVTFAIKISTVFVSVAICLLIFLVAPDLTRGQRDQCFEDIAKGRIYSILNVKKIAAMMAVVFGLATGMWIFTLPWNSHSLGDLIHKWVFEDIFCLLLFVCLLCPFFVVAYFILWPLSYKRQRARIN